MIGFDLSPYNPSSAGQSTSLAGLGIRIGDVRGTAKSLYSVDFQSMALMPFIKRDFT